MQLTTRALSKLAELICADSGSSGGFSWKNFPYRSSAYLSEFFENCNLPYRHDGSTRKAWVLEVLKTENATFASSPPLPPDTIITVIQELLEPAYFANAQKDRHAALQDLNALLGSEGLQAYFDDSGKCQLQATGTNANSAGLTAVRRRAWTVDELRRRREFASFLDAASEDELTEQLLVPLFQQLGFQRISVAGHKDKRLEFGTDLWMKLRLPTRHFIYFGCQIKKEKIDAAGRSDTNVSGILNQITMMVDYPVFDSETNGRHLLDHVYIISSGEITKQAKTWLAQHLDASKRRHIIFMDREDLLDLSVLTLIRLPEFRSGPDVAVF